LNRGIVVCPVTAITLFALEIVNLSFSQNDLFETIPKMLMLSEEFIHVYIARHRPQSNGIAERFVRTLKEWLADKTWPDDQELATLLCQFLDEYNNRPHQGLPIPGLSPNQFANRIWLM
jgi:hypothetical protein